MDIKVKVRTCISKEKYFALRSYVHKYALSIKQNEQTQEKVYEFLLTQLRTLNLMLTTPEEWEEKFKQYKKE